MKNRTQYWPAKIAAIVNELPGISLSELGRRTKKLPTQERWRILDELLAAGRIRWSEVEANDRNQKSTCFWPMKPQEGQQSTPADQATAALHDARKALQAATEAVNAALAHLASPSPAIATAE
jgi:hypothetical protein